MTGMTEEALLETAEACFRQLEGIMPDEDNVDDYRELCQKYMEAYGELLARDFDKHAGKAADAYYTLVDIYEGLDNTGLLDEDDEGWDRLKIWTRILDIHKELAKKDTKHLKDVADDYNCLGEVYDFMGKEEKAEKMYDKAEELWESIKKA